MTKQNIKKDHRREAEADETLQQTLARLTKEAQRRVEKGRH
jgi:hypothetical protein